MRGIVDAEQQARIVTHTVSVISTSSRDKCVINFATIPEVDAIYSIGTHNSVIEFTLSKITFCLVNPPTSSESTITFGASLFILSSQSSLSIVDSAFTVHYSSTIYLPSTIPSATLQTSLIDATHGQLILTNTSFYWFTTAASSLLQVSPAPHAFDMQQLCEFYFIDKAAPVGGSVFDIKAQEDSEIVLQNALITTKYSYSGSPRYVAVLDLQTIPTSLTIRNIALEGYIPQWGSPPDPTHGFQIKASSATSFDEHLDFFADIYNFYSPPTNFVFVSAPGSSFELAERLSTLNKYVYVDPNYYSTVAPDCGGTTESPCKTLQQALDSGRATTNSHIVRTGTYGNLIIDSAITITASTTIRPEGSNLQIQFGATESTSELPAPPVITIGDESNVVSVSFVKVVGSRYYSSSLPFTSNVFFVSKDSELTLAQSNFSVPGANFYSSFINAVNGKLRLSRVRFESFTMYSCPLIDLSWTPGCLTVLGGCYFSVTRNGGRGSVFEIHVSGEDNVAEILLHRLYFYECKCKDDDNDIYGGAIYMYLAAKPAVVSFDQTSYRVPYGTTNCRGQFLYIESRIRNYLYSNPFFLPFDSVDGMSENVIVIRDYDGIEYEFNDFKPQVFIAVPSEDAQIDKEPSTGLSECGSILTPCYSINEAMQSQLFCMQNFTTLTFQAGAHPTTVATFVVDSPLLFQGSKEEGALTSSFSIAAPQETTASALFLAAGSDAQLNLARLIIYVSSPEDSPLAIPAFRTADDGSISMTDVAIRGKEKPMAPMLTNLLQHAGKSLKMDTVSISHIRLLESPLNDFVPTSNHKHVIYTDIVRSSGSGSVFETVAPTGWANTYTLSSTQFIQCRCLHGNGGAIAIEAYSYASVSVSGTDVWVNTPNMFQGTQASKRDDASDDDVGHGNAMYIKTDGTASLYFQSITFPMLDSVGPEVYIDLTGGDPTNLVSSLSSILMGSYLTKDNYIIRSEGEEIEFIDLISTIHVDPSDAAATEEDCGSQEQPCTTLDAALSSPSASSNTYVQLHPGSISPMKSKKFVNYHLLITSTDYVADTTVLSVKDNGLPDAPAHFDLSNNYFLTLNGFTLQLTGTRLNSAFIQGSMTSAICLFNLIVCQENLDSPVTCYAPFITTNAVIEMANVVFSNIILEDSSLIAFTFISSSTDTYYAIVNHDSVKFENILRNHGNGSVFSGYFRKDTDYDYSMFELSDLEFVNCSAPEGYGGAIYLDIQEPPRSFSLKDLKFTEVSKSAAIDGAAVYIYCDVAEFISGNAQAWRHTIGDHGPVEDLFVLADHCDPEHPQRHNLFELLPPLVVDATVDEDYTVCGTEVTVPCNTLYEVFAPSTHILHSAVTLAAQRHPAEQYQINIEQAFRIEGEEDTADTILNVAPVTTENGDAAEALFKFNPTTGKEALLVFDYVTFTITSTSASGEDHTLTHPLLLIGANGGHVSFSHVDIIATPGLTSFAPIQSTLIDTQTGHVALTTMRFDSLITATDPLLHPSITAGLTFSGVNSFVNITRLHGSGSVLEVILVSNDTLQICGVVFDTCTCKCGNGGALYINVTDEASLTLGSGEKKEKEEGQEESDEEDESTTTFISCSATKSGCETTQKETPAVRRTRRNDEETSYGGALYLAVESNDVSLSFGTLTFGGDAEADVGSFLYLASEDADLLSNTELWESLKEAVGDSENAMVIEDTSDPENPKQYDIHELIPEEEPPTTQTSDEDTTETTEEVIRVVESSNSKVPTGWIVVLVVLAVIVVLALVVIIITYIMSRRRQKESDTDEVELSDMISKEDYY